ncbi:MAG: cell filamentation protein Fic, partial [Bacteroidetes bacterium]
HCFPNGNGRHSRLITDTLLEDVLGKTRFSWGSSDLTNAGNARNEYIKALRSADNGDLEPLKSFVRK